jgi:NADPH:quinone reductase-like Zn-dependent oxidoreductase
MAKQSGAYVIAVCSKKNISLVKSLGSDEIINYENTSFVEVLTNNKIDLVGGKEIEQNAMKILKNMDSLKPSLAQFAVLEINILAGLGF